MDYTYGQPAYPPQAACYPRAAAPYAPATAQQPLYPGPQQQPQQYPPCSPFGGAPGAEQQPPCGGAWNPCGACSPAPATPTYAAAYPPQPAAAPSPYASPPRSPQYPATTMDYPLQPAASCPATYPGMMAAPQPSLAYCESFAQGATYPGAMPPGAAYPPAAPAPAMGMGGLPPAMQSAPSYGAPPAGYPQPQQAQQLGGGMGYGARSAPTTGPLGAGMEPAMGGYEEQPDFCYPGKAAREDGKFKLSDVKGKDVAKSATKVATIALKMAFG